jgi:hypothetical protein
MASFTEPKDTSGLIEGASRPSDPRSDGQAFPPRFSAPGEVTTIVIRLCDAVTSTNVVICAAFLKPDQRLGCVQCVRNTKKPARRWAVTVTEVDEWTRARSQTLKSPP